MAGLAAGLPRPISPWDICSSNRSKPFRPRSGLMRRRHSQLHEYPTRDPNQPSETVLEQHRIGQDWRSAQPQAAISVTEQRSAAILVTSRREVPGSLPVAKMAALRSGPSKGGSVSTRTQTVNWAQEIPNAFPKNVGAPTLKVILEG